MNPAQDGNLPTLRRPIVSLSYGAVAVLETLPEPLRTKHDILRILHHYPKAPRLKKINRDWFFPSKQKSWKKSIDFSWFFQKSIEKKSIDVCLKNQLIFVLKIHRFFCCVFPSFLLFWMGFLLNICASYFTYFHVYMCIYIYTYYEYTYMHTHT